MSLRRHAVALLLIAVLVAFAAPSGAHDNPTPVVDVGHALLWDAAWDVDSPQGRLFQVLAEDPTQMASTTKSWTLHLAMEALEAGQVDLGDIVTAETDTVLGSVWVPSGSSLMTDSSPNQVPLQAGEQVMFADLLRGMMYPSGNDAAATIAKHVARGIWGNDAGVADFVNLMTFHAWAHGYTDSWFTNPAGLDGNPAGLPGGDHRTTPRDQVRWWRHAYASHELYRDIVGFSGTYAFTTTLGLATKSYSYGWGFAYRGWEGHKGGDTNLCSGPNEGDSPNTNDYGCMIMSATRLGRQVVMSFMQGKWADTLPGSGQAPLLDYAFAKIFHPDIRGQSVPWGASVQDHDLACDGNGRAASAVFRTGHPLRLVVWGTDVDGSEVPKLGESVTRFRGPFIKLPGSGDIQPDGRGDPGPGPGPGPSPGPGKGSQQKPVVRTVAVIHMDGGTFVTAARVGGTVTLARWFVAADNTVTLVGTEASGPANGVALQRLTDDMFLLVMKQPTGDLKLETWTTLTRRGGSAFILLDSHVETGHEYSEIGVTGIHTGVLFGGGDPRAVTVATTIADQLVYHVWSIASNNGAITKKDTLTSATDAGGIAITNIPVLKKDGEILAPAHVATAYRQSAVTVLRFHSIDSSGQIVFENAATVDPGTYTGHRVVPFGSNGLLLLGRDAAGDSRFFVFDLLRDAFNNVNPGRIAVHTSLAGSDFEPCRQATTHSEADVILARENVNGALQVTQYRMGDLPY